MLHIKYNSKVVSNKISKVEVSLLRSLLQSLAVIKFVTEWSIWMDFDLKNTRKEVIRCTAFQILVGQGQGDYDVNAIPPAIPFRDQDTLEN